MAHGWTTARVCAETEFWDDDSMFKRLPRDERRLHDLLDEVARIPGAQLLLIGNCTLKGQRPLAEQEEWNRRVIDIINGHYPGGGAVPSYDNVAYEVVNEPWHPMWGVPPAVTAGMIREAQRHGLIAMADDHACASDTRLRSQYEGFPDFHPCREMRLTRKFISRLVEANGGFALLSEPAPLEEIGLEAFYADLAACRQAGCFFTFHSIAGLRAESYGEWPDARH